MAEQASSTTSGNGIDREWGMPGMMSQQPNDNTDIYRDYTVRYYKGNVDDLEQLAMLEEIQTKALSPTSTGVVLLEAKNSFFQDQFIVVLKYLQKRPSSN